MTRPPPLLKRVAANKRSVIFNPKEIIGHSTEIVKL